MNIRVLNAKEVVAALPMKKAIDVMRTVFSAYSAGETTVPLRGQIQTDKGVTLLMPAFLHKNGELGVKVVSIYGDNPKRNLPVINAAVLVLDSDTGVPKALLNGTFLTALRTGAAGGLAADVLARKDSRIMALFGAGVQARTQLMAVLTVRKIEKVFLVDPVEKAARVFAEEISRWPNAPTVEIVTDVATAVSQADIVAAATTSVTPVFNGDDLKPGTHVTAVGSFQPHVQEIDATTVHRATIVVDSAEACLEETGDLIIPGARVDAEIGEVINGTKPGRTTETEITFFKSVGIAAQDAAAAAAVLREAEKGGFGVLVDLD